MGYYEGEFLKWFEDYFPNSIVYGIDNKLFTVPDIKTFQIDQNDGGKLLKFGSSFGDFDIIIDDASHCEKETKNTFNYLWRFVKSGGWYVIEDWGAYYAKPKDYGNTGQVICDILLNKELLEIEEIKIIYKPSVSIAFFKKK